MACGHALRWLRTTNNWFPSYADHTGFTLIALFEGFIIAGGMDLGAPGWLTAAVAVLGVIAGNRVVRRIQTQWNQLGTVGF